MIWKKAKLIDIATISTGKWDANHSVKNGKYRFYTCASKHLYSNTKRFSGECLILPGNGANVGDVYYYDGVFDAYQRTYVIQNIKILPKFLYYHLILNWREANKNKQFGSATNFIKIGNFQNYVVSFPPLSEQRKIVTKLENIFQEIDDSINLVKYKEDQIDKFNMSILSKNIEEEIEFTKIPFEMCLKKISIKFKLPKKEYLNEGKFPVVSQEAVLISGYHNNSENVLKLDKPVIIFGDHTQVLKYIDFDFVVGADGTKILLTIENINPKYFYYVLMMIMPKNTGYARHYKLLKKLYIPIPTLSKQLQIVSKFDSIFAESELTRKAIEKVKNNYINLKSSILSQNLQSSKVT